MHNIPTNFPAATVSPPHRELEKKARQQKPHTEQAPAREYRLNSGLYPAHMDVITSILPIFFHILCPFSPGPPPMCPPETRRQKERQLDVNSVTGVRPDHPSRTQLITVNSRLFLVCLFFSLGRALPSTICCLFLFCYRVFHAPLHFPCPNLRSTSQGQRASARRLRASHQWSLDCLAFDSHLGSRHLQTNACIKEAPIFNEETIRGRF